MPRPTHRPRSFRSIATFASALSLGVSSSFHSVAVPAGPPLAIERDSRDLVITWAGGGWLEMASDPGGPWTALPDATSPHRVPQPSSAAFFRAQTVHALTVSQAGSGAGRIESTPAGILCGTDCTETLPAGRTLTLQAVPEAGSTFGGWSGDCTGTGDCLVTLDRARSVTATFLPAATANPFVNGDFEQGPLVGWEQAPGQVILPAANLVGAAPYSGQYAAYLGYDRDGRRLVQLGQRVTLPARQPIFLNFAAWVYSEELCDVPWYDRITLYVNGQIAFQNDRVCRGSGTDGWLRFSVDVSAVAGQSAAFVFEIYSADALSSILLLDDIAIADQPWGL